MGPKRARAERAYLKTWNKADSYFGADKTNAPRYRWGGNDQHNSYVSRPNGSPMVNVDAGVMKRLGKQGKGKPPAKRQTIRRAKKDARRTLIHEWAHVYQAPEMTTNSEMGEAAATKFAQEVSRDLYGYRSPYFQDEIAAYEAKYGPDHWQQQQFGSNYGKDPTTIGSSRKRRR